MARRRLLPGYRSGKHHPRTEHQPDLHLGYHIQPLDPIKQGNSAQPVFIRYHPDLNADGTVTEATATAGGTF